MNKPDWRDAPDGYDYLAQDKNGSWYWHKDKPETRSNGWWSKKYGQGERAFENPDWKNTLEERPKRPRIREDIKAGDYLYRWRYQGYIKVVKVVHNDPRHRNEPYLEVCCRPFYDGIRKFDMDGHLLSEFVNPLVHVASDYFHPHGTFDIFNDLDTYYEYVKATTNTPTKE